MRRWQLAICSTLGWILAISLARVGVAQPGLPAGTEIGYIERFALAEDRGQVLEELIPGTEDYYYYHCLHCQNTGDLDRAEALLTEWRTKRRDSPAMRDMLARQMLLTYPRNPQRTLDFLRNELHLNLHHAPPSKDRSSRMPHTLDVAAEAGKWTVESLIARDPTLAQIETSALPQLLDQNLAPQQLRALLSRIDRADHPRIVDRIAEELQLRDAKEFGWAPVHALLTLEQLESLATKLPRLRESEAYIRAYAARLAPPGDQTLEDPLTRRAYLERLAAWARALPPSQNSLKALVLGRLLELNMQEGRWDRELFLEYLALPRNVVYYNPLVVRQGTRNLANLNFALQPEIPLRPIRDDSVLVRRYLEHFLQTASSTDDYAPYLDRDYLARVLAETRILYGIGDAAQWYARLSPDAQRELRNRIELRFAPQNPLRIRVEESAKLQVELKNVPELIVRVYEINTLAYYRHRQQPISSDIDLDGLVPNATWRIAYDLPADRRHVETLDFSEHMPGRGVWVVDLFGGGRRARTVVRKGQLFAVDRLGDAGHVFQIFDDQDNLVTTAHLEIDGQVYEAEATGAIVVPYAEEEKTRSMMVVDRGFATRQQFVHRAETYHLEAALVLEEQALVPGQRGRLILHPRLTCNGQPISMTLLEDVTLEIRTTDADGIESSIFSGSIDATDTDDLLHEFLVPSRIRQVRVELQGRIYNRSKDQYEDLVAVHSRTCCTAEDSLTIADLYLQRTSEGARVYALGRNGEPVSGLPLTVAIKPKGFTRLHPFQLATDQHGKITLQGIEAAERVQVSGRGLAAPLTFATETIDRAWPERIQVPQGTPIRLPLGAATDRADDFLLQEMRGGTVYGRPEGKLRIVPGMVVLEDLPAGEFQLIDYSRHHLTQLFVTSGKTSGEYVFGHRHIIEPTKLPPAIIESAQIIDGRVAIHLAQWDAATRVHIVGTVFEPSVSRAAMDVTQPGYARWSRGYARNLFVDSLTLDEEYRYILERQTAEKFPGNLLPQPSLLIHPWEITTAENLARDAQAGDAIPNMAEPQSRAGKRGSRMRRGEATDERGRRSYAFLRRNAVVRANLMPDVDGWVYLDGQQLDGCSTVLCLAVHPLGNDARQVPLPVERVPVRDLRLARAFDLDQPIQRVRRIDVIEQGQPLRFEDANSGRIQLYTTVADVFDLYATLVDSPHWDDFRFLRHWDVLEDAAKRREYDAHGCHELDLFLYFKDRPFFDAVVAPVLRNKLEKRLVDRWLLGQDIAPYAELWRMRRLNAVERMLLSRRVPALAAGTRRFLAEWSDAHPVSPEREQQLFEFALLRSQLAAPGMAGNMMGGEAGYGGMGGAGWSGLGDAMRLDEDAAAMAPAAPVPGRADANQERKMEELRLGRAAQPMEEVEGLFFGADRRALGQGRGRQLFRSLDQTREWAESNYYRLKLDQESSELVRPNAFWLEVFDSGTGPILPRHMHLPVNNFHEALLALAFIDLPFSAQPPHIEMRDGAATIECSSDAILLSERYEAADGATAENAPPIMVGHEIYLAEDDPQTARPVTERPLVRGVAYRSNVVISNPTAMPVVVDVLLQIPQGALPLEGTKAVRSVSIPLGPYETRQIEGAFYFPASGEFSMYGAQVSIAGRHVRGAPGRAVRVLDAPVIEDQDSWEYVADWAPPQRVLEFLRQANLHQIDLARMAFRMEDREFYNSALKILEQSGVFDAALWAYAVRHDDPPRIEQLLQHNEPFLQRLGSHLDSPLLQIIPEQRGWYEYLEYRPLVVARAHRLGAQREILNNRLREQYLRLMRVLAHQAVIAPAQRLQLSYYMLLQNRIAEAIQHFGRVDRQTIEPVASYDYMDAYLAMYRGDYERAGRLADAYSDHPSPRQRAMFAQVRMQLDQRRALLEGTELAAATELGMDPASRALTNQREVQQAEMARRNPALELEQSGGRLIAHLHNVEQIQIGFYEMDVELLFSRRPFATTQDAAAPIVQPNHRVEVDTIGQESLVIDIPPQLQHKNLIVEVQAAGIARRQLVTAGQLRVVLVEPYGRLQVTDARGGQPVVGAYVKVYARHRDGSEKFFKDGYTDLRGQFDYATLSTGDLDSVEEFSILVLDEELGPSIHQARPPAR